MAKNVLLKLFLTLTCFMVGLSAFAQGKPVTLNAVDMPLPDALVKIERMSEYYKFNYNVRSLQQFKVTASITEQQAPEAVSTLISGLPLTMTVNGKYIEIASKADAAQTSSTPRIKGITGEVLDEDGEPLVGVHVRERGSKNGVITDMDGRFKISTNADKMKLTLSYIGMKDAEVTATNGVPVKVVMITNSVSVGEVVVTGYQVIDKRASTSAITSIKAEDVIRPDAISIDQMLEGQVPDLMYMSNSGEAGAAPKIRIRGTSSIIGNREPLWVVDGIVVNDPVAISAEDLNDPDYVNRIGNAIAGLNPQDIERLDVLKDASATALYGTKAANGVIVITTKRGQEGPATIRYSNSFTWKRRPRYTDKSVDVMNSYERIQMSRDLFAQHYQYGDRGSLIGYEGLIQQYYKGEITPDQFADELSYYEQVNTDWFDLLTHDSFSQQHTVNITGGSEKASYYGSLGFTDNDDVIKNTMNRRYNAMVNMDVKFSKIFTASFGLQGNVQNRDYNQPTLNPIQYAYKTSRAIPAYDRVTGLPYYYSKMSGTYYGASFNYNVVNELENSGVTQDASSVTFNANLRFKFNSWLSANAIFSYTNSNTTIESLWGDKTWRAAVLRDSNYGEEPGYDCVMPQGGELTVNQTRQKSWTARLQLDWNKYFNDELHNFAGGIGIEANQLKYQGYSNVTRGYFPDRGMTFVQGIDLDAYPGYKTWLADNVPTLTDSKSNTLSGYITASYNYDRLIYLNANARVDGSNNFGDTSNDKLLPIFSVSASFDASRLKWFRELTWLDQFSIKGSYGYQGNMLSSQSPIMIIKKGAYNDYFGEFTSTVMRNPNPNLKWEKTASYNLGFVWSFFNRKLQIDADFYWKRTKDAFMSKTISTVNGYESYIINGGDIDNDGYSIGVTVRPIQTRDWQWSISTVFSRAINRIKSTPAAEEYNLSNFLNGTAIVKGKAIGTFYSYKFLGLNPEDGGPMFDDWQDHYYDLMGLSKYDTYTRVLVATGSREPIMSGSFTTQLRWKDIRLSANFAYSLGAKTRLFGMYGSGAEGSVYAQAGEIKSENNLSRDYLDRWLKPGDEKYTNIPAIIGHGHPSYFNYNQHFSERMSNDGIQPIANNYWDMYDYSDIRVVSSDYLKLNTLSLSYLVPSQWIRSWGFKRLEVTASATNVFTICDKKLKGQTPTQGGFSTIQLSDRPGYSVGLSVTF
ncbi:MAG: SusC/RagA family TonB-linked outer membrane protein [Muribaculaceae bacterium]|nr:SusC/RagA family TonB-linked outer membrane protein [Muribaculaceae bacterium]